MDVHPENELLAGDEAERANETPIAVVADDPLILPAGKRVRSRRADLEVAGMRPVADETAQRHQRGPHRWNVGARNGRDLQDRLQELRLDLSLRWLLAQDRVDRADEVERGGVEKHQLLLDSHRVSGTNEAMIHAGTLSGAAVRSARAHRGCQGSS